MVGPKRPEIRVQFLEGSMLHIPRLPTNADTRTNKETGTTLPSTSMYSVGANANRLLSDKDLQAGAPRNMKR